MADTASAEELAILGAGTDDKADDKVDEKVPEVGDKKVSSPLVEDEPESEDESEQELESDKVEEPTKDDEPLHERPTIAQLKEKYPDILKTFPSLRSIYYREQQFSELFPTPADAKEAAENNEAFETVRNDLYEGDGTQLLEALKETGHLDKFSKTILNSLYKVSPEAQWSALAPVFQNAIRAFYNSSDDDNDKNAALRLSKYLFGDPEVASGKKTAVKSEPEAKKSSEEENWKTERYNSFNIDTLSTIYDNLKTEIGTGLDDTLSSFVKDAIVDRTISEIRKQLESDKAHMAYMSTLWSKANKNGYTTADKSSITSAFLARAKAIVPSIRRRLVAEALGTSAKINSKKLETVEKGQQRREPGASGKVPMNGNKIYNPRDIDFSKTSEMDILNGNVTLKNRK